ncbi:MAG: amidohydrolase family protein, partial [Cyanobium sp.]
VSPFLAPHAPPAPTSKRSLRQRLPLLKPRVLGGSLVIAAAAIGAVAAGRGLAFVPQKAIEGPLTLANFVKGTTDCFDRSKRPPLAVVDTHLHVRPFGGPPIPYQELMKILRQNGVLFANLYGIGQRLPVQSPCTYYLNCPGEPAAPSLKSDFSNAQNSLDLKPQEVLPQMAVLDKEYPGMFRWMGEVNLAKQALYNNGHSAVPIQAIASWQPFMVELQKRNIPIAIHSDLGNDKEPLKYVPLMEEVLRRYPNNRIVWMHLGLSKELSVIDPKQHIALLESYLRRYPNLSYDISWRVLYDQVFKDATKRDLYVAFMNRWPKRFIPGTDFVAAAGKTEQVYREELAVTSSILAKVNNEAYRGIALGQNYFDLAGLDAVAPQVCKI